MARLSDRVAIVTGAASPIGFGFATARKFAEEGAKVLLTDIFDDEVEARAGELREAGFEAAARRLDVTNEAQWDAAIADVIERFGRLDALVNNAGMVNFGGIADALLTDWNTILNVNLTGTFLGCRAAVRQMAAQGSGGSIVNIASTAANAAFPGLVGYVASKGGVRMLTKAAALDVAAQGIRVNSVHPGHMHTQMMAQGLKSDPEMVKATIARVPLGRLGTADEVAALNLFLASDEASYVTGAEFVVDGGLIAF